MKNKVFFIAEISANHCGSFILAKKLINWKPTTKLIDGLNKTRLFIIKNGK